MKIMAGEDKTLKATVSGAELLRALSDIGRHPSPDFPLAIEMDPQAGDPLRFSAGPLQYEASFQEGSDCRVSAKYRDGVFVDVLDVSSAYQRDSFAATVQAQLGPPWFAVSQNLANLAVHEAFVAKKPVKTRKPTTTPTTSDWSAVVYAQKMRKTFPRKSKSVDSKGWMAFCHDVLGEHAKSVSARIRAANYLDGTEPGWRERLESLPPWYLVAELASAEPSPSRKVLHGQLMAGEYESCDGFRDAMRGLRLGRTQNQKATRFMASAANKKLARREGRR
jgi:hypothetical protein